MSSPADRPVVQSSALLEHRSYVAYWCARVATNAAYQMQAVAVGWQIYELTGNAFDLGLVGLVQFFPVVVLVREVSQRILPAGLICFRWNGRRECLLHDGQIGADGSRLEQHRARCFG